MKPQEVFKLVEEELVGKSIENRLTQSRNVSAISAGSKLWHIDMRWRAADNLVALTDIGQPTYPC